jgi:hypothetical protein
MESGIKTGKVNEYSRVRKILFLLLLITLPFGCCGGTFLLDMLPSSALPPALDFSVNLFEATASVENRTDEIIYITPISTIHGYPQVIRQFDSIRQRDFPLQPNSSIILTYDSADMTLAGIAVCRVNHECKLLPEENTDAYKITSFEELPELDVSWLSAVQSHPERSFYIVYMLIFSLAPIILFSTWIYLGRLEKKKAL